MDEEIAQFVSITGADSERAKFFVESANGDLETAISTFFEADGAQAADVDYEMDETKENAAPIATSVASSTGPRTLTGEPAPDLPANWGKQAAAQSSASKAGGGFSASGGRGGGIATLSDLQGGPGGAAGDDDEDSDDEDGKKPANFYTGGERSGLNVQNPDRHKKGNAPEVVQNILKKAQEQTKKMSEGGGSSSRGGPSASTPSFGGRGRTINDEASQDTTAQTPPFQPQLPPIPSGGINSEYLRALRNMSRGGLPPGQEEEEGDWDENDGQGEIAIRIITFWQDGFTIAGGPLCRYDDPQHASTLAMIEDNRAPLHLLNVKFGQRVQLTVEKKTNEKYKAPPAPPMKAFEGQGNRLGTPVPAMTGETSSSVTVPIIGQTTSTASPATSVPDPSSLTFQVDANQPTTQIQIRLGDGQRMVAKFNHTHTVADIRQFINASHTGMTARPYTLQSSFPPKPLTDEEMSIQEAGLINSVVIQKWN